MALEEVLETVDKALDSQFERAVAMARTIEKAAAGSYPKVHDRDTYLLVLAAALSVLPFRNVPEELERDAAQMACDLTSELMERFGERSVYYAAVLSLSLLQAIAQIIALAGYGEPKTEEEKR